MWAQTAQHTGYCPLKSNVICFAILSLTANWLSKKNPDPAVCCKNSLFCEINQSGYSPISPSWNCEITSNSKSENVGMMYFQFFKFK